MRISVNDIVESHWDTSSVSDSGLENRKDTRMMREKMKHSVLAKTKNAAVTIEGLR